MPKMTAEKKKQYFLTLFENKERLQTDENLVQQLLNNHLQYVPKKKLYKFRTCNNQNFTTLEENSIWMSPASSFPDVFDFTINIDLKKNFKEIEKWLNTNFLHYYFIIMKEKCEKSGNAFPYTYDDFVTYRQTCFDSKGKVIPTKEEAFLRAHASKSELQQFNLIMDKLVEARIQLKEKVELWTRDLLNKMINEARTRMRDKALIYCMTERFDNHSLWENYAANYSGFCIEYCFANYADKGFDDYKNLIYLLPMSYRKRRPYFDIVSLFDAGTREYILKDSVWKRNPTLDADFNMQLYYKDSDYQYEREWRVSIDNKGINKQYFPFVSAIYAGKDIKPRNLKRLRNIAKKLGVPVYQQIVGKTNKFEYVTVSTELGNKQ